MPPGEHWAPMFNSVIHSGRGQLYKRRAGEGAAIAATRTWRTPTAVGPCGSSYQPDDHTMSDYELYYWQMPFRGQFIRAILAHAGKRWDEYDDASVSQLMQAGAAAQAVPFMGPPMLVDKRADIALAEMPAIAYYLGETLGLMPEAIADKAMTLKVVNDANDVIDELTLDGGRQMWTPQRWKKHVPRLGRWMSIWEETGRRHGLTPEAGYLLGGPRTGVADIVTATLWGTLAEKFPTIGKLLDEKAPASAGLTKRLCAQPALANLAAVSRERFGDAYCGGEIEKSLRRVLA
jgi:glutathione S-transferase